MWSIAQNNIALGFRMLGHICECYWITGSFIVMTYASCYCYVTLSSSQNTEVNFQTLASTTDSVLPQKSLCRRIRKILAASASVFVSSAV